MNEYMDKLNEELASAFIISTCQLTTKSSHVYSDHMHNLAASNKPVPKEYSVICGSYAEFYIRPLIGCIDDIDFLIAKVDELVVSGEFPVLPRDLSGLASTIKCFKIEQYESYPGFVRLQLLGEMNYNWKFKKYEYNNTAVTERYARPDLDIIRAGMPLERSTMPSIISGPAIKQTTELHSEGLLGFDFVRSVWCPQWPKEAMGFINRTSNNGWPKIDTIKNVVQNGCHIVYIQHRSCRNDKLQWRFSFSFAEVILLQSLTQIQQIVYHLLRFLAKRELIHKDCRKEDEVLCTYHLKTLMLWTCEEMSPEWWKSSSLIGICCELLKKLSRWFKRRYCPNYFIPNANLFCEPSNFIIFDWTEQRLNEFCSSEILCHWFVENYILSFIRSSSVPIEPMPHFMNYMQPLFECRKRNELKSLDICFSNTFTFSDDASRSIMKHALAPGLSQYLQKEYHFKRHDLKANCRRGTLPTIQTVSGFTFYANLLCILHIAYGLESGEISWDSNVFVDVVNAISMRPNIIKSKYHNFPRTYTAPSCQYEFLRGQDLLQNVTSSTSRPEFQLLSLVSKEFLTKAVKLDGSMCSGIVPAALAYLAALHYATSEYQEATRLCSAVLMDGTSMEDKETLNAGCLLFIDDIARIVGLCVLQKIIIENNLHYINRRIYLDLRLSSEVFVHYLSVLSVERISKKSDCYHALPDSLFYMDVNLTTLIKSMKSGCIAEKHLAYRRPDSVTEAESSGKNITNVRERVLDALMEYALENVMAFYEVIHKDFGVNCNTGDCYRALYLYNCRQYDQVLHLCERILKDSDLPNELREFSFANVLLLPPLDSFFDRDVQSLLGFKMLFYCLFPLNEHLKKVELSEESTFEHYFARYVCCNIPKCQLASFLETTYSIRCHYFLGRHFLARYLNLRCCIDCNLPYSEALAEFAAHNINLPLEHIIRRYLLQNLRI